MKYTLIALAQIIGYGIVTFITNKITDQLTIFFVVSLLYMILMTILNHYLTERGNIE